MKSGIIKKSTIIFVFFMTLFLYTGSVHAFRGILTDFINTYPGSALGTNASCRLCHGPEKNSEWNEYG